MNDLVVEIGGKDPPVLTVFILALVPIITDTCNGDLIPSYGIMHYTVAFFLLSISVLSVYLSVSMLFRLSDVVIIGVRAMNHRSTSRNLAHSSDHGTVHYAVHCYQTMRRDFGKDRPI